jgi:hypothetical protein
MQVLRAIKSTGSFDEDPTVDLYAAVMYEIVLSLGYCLGSTVEGAVRIAKTHRFINSQYIKKSLPQDKLLLPDLRYYSVSPWRDLLLQPLLQFLLTVVKDNIFVKPVACYG